MWKIVPLFVIALLSACGTQTHLYRGQTEGPVAYLLYGTTYEDRNGEYLREGYRPIGIDGKVLRPDWQWVASAEGKYSVLPGLHKIVGRVTIKRGNILNGWAEYFHVINVRLEDGRRYRVTGQPRFADNILEMWIEDADSGLKISDSANIDLSKPTPQPTVVSYPIYIR